MSSGSINIDPHEIDDRGLYPPISVQRPISYRPVRVQGSARTQPRMYRLTAQQPQQPQDQPEVATYVSEESMGDTEVMFSSDLD